MLMYLKCYKVSSYTFLILLLHSSYTLFTPFPLFFVFPNTNSLQLNLKAIKDKDFKDNSKSSNKSTKFKDNNNNNNNNNSNKK